MKTEIEQKIQRILNRPFEIEDIETVPDLNDSRLGFENTGLRFEATVIYLEIRDTVVMLNRNTPVMLEKIRMSYYYVIIAVVHSLGGIVRRAHDDGFYIFFQGMTQDPLNNAVKAAMKMKYILANEHSQVKIMLERYNALNFTIGIDDGSVLCVRAGDKNIQHGDLVWSGEALTLATVIAKKLASPEHIGISEVVHYNLKDTLKYRKNKESTQEIWSSADFDYNQAQQTYFHTSFFWAIT
jgi:class 3 adenylate cyclase